PRIRIRGRSRGQWRPGSAGRRAPARSRSGPRPLKPRLLLRSAGAPRHAAALCGRQGCRSLRQKTPPNAVEIARALLQAGAEPDALADMYGAECTTMSMLVSSRHPAEARLQVPLV